MDLAAELRRAREQAGLTVRELAVRAGTSHSAVVAYEQGQRIPRADTFGRLLAATGRRLQVERAGRPAGRNHGTARHLPDPQRAGEILVAVLDLADALPRRPASRHLDAPRFPR